MVDELLKQELGINPSEAQIEEMSEKCTFFGKRTLGNIKVLGKEEIKAIYTYAAQA